MTENGTLTVHEALRVYTDLLRRVALTRHGVTFSGDRDLYATLGYKRALRFEDYYERYQRGGLAHRIINAFPDATWRDDPIVREADKPDETVETPFEAAWAGLVQRLGLWQQFVKLDRLASLGYYAVMVLGLRGQPEWDQPATPVQRGPDDLLYVQVFSQEHASVLRLVSDARSPLFGQPALYNVDFSRRFAETHLLDPLLRPIMEAQYATLVPVHASRLIHVAEDGLEDNIIGTPRLHAVWNLLDDYEKVMGGSAEMFWQDAKRRLVLNLSEGATLDDPTALTAEVEEFMHEMRNFLRVQGMEVTQLSGTIPNPAGNVDKIVEGIAATLAIPQRILLGSERGELGSDQDEQNWLAGTVRTRQRRYAEPVILRQFIDICLALRILPPVRAYEIEWPPARVPTEEERANVALLWSRAIATYAGTLTSAQDIVPLEIFLKDILEWPQDQVEAIMELLAERVEVTMGEPALAEDAAEPAADEAPEEAA